MMIKKGKNQKPLSFFSKKRKLEFKRGVVDYVLKVIQEAQGQDAPIKKVSRFVRKNFHQRSEDKIVIDCYNKTHYLIKIVLTSTADQNTSLPCLVTNLKTPPQEIINRLAKIIPPLQGFKFSKTAT